MTYDLAELNEKFALPGQLTFKSGDGDFPFIEVMNSHALAIISVYGGHVLAYQPLGQAPILWVSDSSHYQEGKAIRGGIPVIWPWFGPHRSDTAKPSHGIARTRMWQVLATKVLPDDACQIRLGLSNDATTTELWPHPFNLEIEITVGTKLTVTLIAKNLADKPVTYGAALHTYFTVSAIGDIQILGLEDTLYIDQLDDNQRKTQTGPITFAAETDRIYVDTEADCVIDDPGLKRKIRIAKYGSRSTVVWNPWIAKSQRMADMGDEEYHSMVCVETANAADDVRVVGPGETHRLSVEIWLE